MIKKTIRKTMCQMCGKETTFDKKFNKYFCNTGVYAGNEADIIEQEEK